MITRLDQLLVSIHPEQTRETTHRRADEAIVSFRIRGNIVTDAILYRDILCEFVQHLDHHMMLVPLGTRLPENMLWRRAVDLLRKAFGDHGELAAFDIVRTGAEGGLLHGVLRRLALTAARQQAEKEVATRVDGFCQRLSAEEHLAVGREYLEKHGHLLPREMSEGFAGRARVNLAELLKRHHRALATLNDVGRY